MGKLLSEVGPEGSLAGAHEEISIRYPSLGSTDIGGAWISTEEPAMIRKSVGIILATAAIAVGASSSAWCVPVATYTSLPTTWEKTSNPYVENCTTHRTCHWSNSSAAMPVSFHIGAQVPADWAVVSLQILNPTLGPLVVGGTTITATQLPCPPGGCPVDALHPAPAGGQWYEFATNDVPSAAGSGSLDFVVVAKFDVGALVNPVGRTVSAWMSDDGNARYGNIVIEDFAEGPFSFTIPILTAWGAIFAALLLMATGFFALIRKRRAALA